MVAGRTARPDMEVANIPEDVLLANRTLWLKHEQMYTQKSRLKR